MHSEDELIALNDGVLDELSKLMSEKVPEDRLQKLHKGAEIYRLLILAVEQAEEGLAICKARLREYRFKTLPDLMNDAQTTLHGLPAEGNLPACTLELKSVISAKLPAGKEELAFEWLRENGHGDLIKSKYTIECDKGDTELVDSVLLDNGIDYDRKRSVHYQTLNAFVRSEVKEGHVLPDDILGIFRGQMVTIKEKE